MKFINYLSTIGGIEIYPMISLFIFFTFFTALLFFVFTADKGYLKKLENIPFENE
ncbi:MAG: CcoQ/FixQ family Cbb3-type cytochrome c oxidase assembly chaperone [Bacteroidia bacterium]|nr:CcoQ/FixQ family Cbb3-type cytochrome c oxidase assembly chaperone [Bacteroidia bacterium]